MNNKSGYAILSVIVVLVIISVAVIYSGILSGNNSGDNPVENKDIIQIRGFSVNTDSTELTTSAKGTLFIKGSEGIPENIQIVAGIEIDPEDWGGVAFYIPDGWHISDITSSFPENKTGAMPPEYYVATWTPAEYESEWSAMIEVGRDHTFMPVGGGTGTVLIDLVPDKNAVNMSWNSNISVVVGSDEKNGVRICGTDSIGIPISVMDNK
ncbi:hypothetical protein [Methanoplanus endosymbiosus]|uniref:Uncharacterized protein n=1 Tax=Methanoplanus endosymbiosus TaxID=33865 RepID=A0A9E7PJM5_9EURY|nr:hypothetical protein [Methanoplanus endosymbiosus]UUX91145.1 hypothetical protein L6E24_07055 [Methanoplanus endosymbiosus]